MCLIGVTGDEIQVGSGAYIGLTWVLTVAQNLKDNLDLIRCGFGNVDREQLTWVQGLTYLRHPQYEPMTLANNIGVILLASNPTSVLTTPIPMATPQTQQGAGVVGLQFGFGFTTNEGAFALHLQQATKVIQTDALCVNTYPHLTNRVATEFCALGQAALNTPSACRGDQGGPFSVNEVLVGLYSFNRNSDCFSGHSAAFVRVSAYREWIALVTNL